MLPLAEPYRLRAALKMVRLLRPRAGLRESGVAPAEFPLVAIRSTALKMDAVVAAAGRRGPGRSSLIGTPAMRPLCCTELHSAAQSEGRLAHTCPLLQNLSLANCCDVCSRKRRNRTGPVRWVVPPEYLELAVGLAAEKMRANWAKLERLAGVLRAG